VAALAALLNNVLEMRIDSAKACLFANRPMPRTAISIGAWSDILSLVSFLAIITNAFLAVYSSELMSSLTGSNVVVVNWVFVASVGLLLILKYIMTHVLVDRPQAINDHLERQEYIVDFLILGKGIKSLEHTAQDDGEDDKFLEKLASEQGKRQQKWYNRLGLHRKQLVKHSWKASMYLTQRDAMAPSHQTAFTEVQDDYMADVGHEHKARCESMRSC